MKTILTIILFILMLTIIISIHEFGHFITAKLFNVYVFEYSIGMGKKLFSKKGKETLFSIRLLPIGGYCSLAGEEDNDLQNNPDIDVDISSIPPERTLNGIAKWKKIIILLSGVFMNFLLALLIVSMVFLSYGKIYNSPKPIVNEVKVGYPAYEAGIIKDDEILEVKLENGYSFSPETMNEFSNFMSLYEKGEITLLINRDGKKIEFKVTPIYDEESEYYVIGISSYEVEVVEMNILNCFQYGFSYLLMMTKLIWTTLLGLFRGVGFDNLSGPVGIYRATSDAVNAGMSTYVLLIGAISLNIGIFNLLPIPALDGGRVVLTLVEAIIRRPINKKLENIIMTISVLIFILLMLFATGSDILRLFRGN